VRDLELALKAAADPTRTRILKLLEPGGLCVCQVQAVLGLATSTVSKHLALLKVAGLVEDRRTGKWIEYRLADGERNPYVKPVLELLRGSLERDPTIQEDRRRLREIRRIPLVELCEIGPPAERDGSRPRVLVGSRKKRGHA